MNKLKKSKAKKFLTASVATALCCTLSLSTILPLLQEKEEAFATGDQKEVPTVSRVNGKIDNHLSDYFDTNVVQKLPDTVKKDEEISVIVKMNMDTLVDEFDAAGTAQSARSVGEYVSSNAGKRVQRKISKAGDALKARLKKEGLKFEVGEEYSVLISGFEATMKASEFEDFALALGDEATAIVSEEYARCETQLVNNDVNVYDTGIFDSSDSKYDGTGTVIAVLDTGLDYTHSAFDPSRFDAAGARLTQSTIQSLISRTSAASTTLGLTAEDVYLNAKVPYAYDYADKDPDVYPISSEHGTHVSGVIVGEDDVITGVATNAQLVSMKVFSDIVDGARDSWLLAALEDCVVLEVDVINMSLGTGAGFSRQEDKQELQNVYDKIQERGISLVVAASNDYNSTFASEKNGNLGLTSNPDSATIGSPGSYESTLAVASISGTKTPYLTYNGTIIYFTESSNKAAERKHFVDEILPAGVNEQTFEYVTIPGVGRAIDYTGLSMAGKIALVRRGSTSFEEKARTAMQSGAAGLIVYNNVSGDISMTVGNVNLPVCSVSQSNGELLAAQSTGRIVISRLQTAGPFMSDFSSWGPTPDLHIKPEITAHGGDIYSAVPGQSYDRMSGTSMAAPNQAGVTALVRQYVKETFADIANDPVAVTNRVNQLMMSTADIAYNVNGLPYSVRKQGAGLANLTKSTSSPAYVTTYDKSGKVMDKPKFELGDDPDKTGVYTMKFAVNNFGNSALSYNVDAIVQTEGVSETKTHQGDTTVTQEGYTLSGASVRIAEVKDGTSNGNTVTVEANSAATVTVEVTLSAADKQYLDSSFANGMYVEGYITVTAAAGGTQNNLNVPYLAFYGDWSRAPIFDKDYYETNKDELDDSIDTLDKNLPDAYATRPVAGLYDDYIGYLGAYPYTQNPTATPIAADRKYSALSNDPEALNSIYAIFAGMLRGAKRMVTTITDASTGEVIFTDEKINQRKSFSNGMTIFQSILYEDFDVASYNLKNNTQYNVKIQAYLDYENDGEKTNLRNTFEFPFVTDFEAPAMTGCDFYTEYDRTEKKTKLFARMSVYDNHYVSALQIGTVYTDKSTNSYAVNVFDRYLTPVYSEFNTDNVVTYELTDYMDQIKSSYNGRSFVVTALDYAMNQAMYEITIPDTVLGIYFDEEEIKISPNETYDLNPVVTPSDTWLQSLDFLSSNESIARIVNGKLIGIKPGEVTVSAVSNDGTKRAEVKVTVLGEGDAGYQRFDPPAAEQFVLTGYYVEKAYYFLTSEERDIGETGNTIQFVGSGTRSLKMFPSESVTLKYNLRSYFPNATSVTFESSNPTIARVDGRTGTITAVAEGSASITVQLRMNDMTQRSEYVSIEVKNPYETSGPYLVRYTGLGGRVVIPAELSLTEIQQYAFSAYEYVPKDANDEISDDDPLNTKPVYIGENTITEVVIPEGVKTIGNYAFAGLTALKKITLPSTLEKISFGAFYGCTALEEIEGAQYIKFINNEAFYGCNNLKTVNFGRIIAIGDSAFEKTFTAATAANAPAITITLPETAQSIGRRAFAGNLNATELTIQASQVKLGDEAFYGCSKIQSASVNAAVIPTGLFDSCSALSELTLGKNVSIISPNAFRDTRIAKFKVAEGNLNYKAQEEGAVLVSPDGTKLLLAAPAAAEVTVTKMPSLANVTEIGSAAFSGSSSLRAVSLPSVTKIGAYAFANCSNLGVSVSSGSNRVEGKLELGGLTFVGDYAFYNAGITEMPNFSADLKEIGEYSFAGTGVKTVRIPDHFKVGDAAFEDCLRLEAVEIGDNVVVGIAAFRCAERLQYNSAGTAISYRFPSRLVNVTIGTSADLQPDAFYGVAATAIALGDGAKIGDGAFYNAYNLKTIDLSAVKSIGFRAFSGMIYLDASYNLQVKAPLLEEVDLSACETLGAEAFMFCHSIQTVKLGDNITAVPENAFYAILTLDAEGNEVNFSSLTEVEGIEHVQSFGAGAFHAAKFAGTLDVSAADTIGDTAFSDCTEITSVILKSGATLGIGAFANDVRLATVVNLDKATSIDSEAFYHTALTEANVSSATYLGDRVFIGTKVTSAVLGDGLTTIGENPFAGCVIPAFTKVVNGERVSTYDIGENIKVIRGALYRVVPNGLELVIYPAAATDGLYRVEEGTVRIGARAFENSVALTAVDLPATVKSIGHKAFYDCKRLTLVTFNSVNAPILEEEYDESYQLAANLPMIGDVPTNLGNVPGLGIVPFRMWNYVYALEDGSTAYNIGNFYYGANFVNYVGKQDQALVMVRPSNGAGYDTFIFNKYFNRVIESTAVLLEDTKEVIEMINALPDYITLADKAAVEAASAAFNRLSSDQWSLVAEMPYAKDSTLTLREKLTAAESTITWLESQNTTDPTNPDNPSTDPTNPAENDSNAALTGVLGGLGAGLGVILIAFIVCFVLYKTKFAKKAATVESAETESVEPDPETVADDKTEETAEVASEQSGDKAGEADVNDGKSEE